MQPWALTAADALSRMRTGKLTCEELVRSCLERIEETEPTVKAWAHLDPDHALRQARAVDEHRARGADFGPLHGLPIGVKDIFDTREWPTECGTVLMAGRRPRADAHVVSLLKAAGAVIMGKTVTTELAMYSPDRTTNPHDVRRTPGGSSSGSAAAVATGMASLSIGSQTNGSVIRPAAYCGVVGYKPTHGLMSRKGMLALSRPLDTVGVFARTLEDVALLAEPLLAYDGQDPDMTPRVRPRLRSAVVSDPPVTPRLAFVQPPVREPVEADARAGFKELVARLGDACDEVALPEPFDRALECHRTLLHADIAKGLAGLYERSGAQLSDVLCAMIEDGRTILAVDYHRALDLVAVLDAGLERVFDRHDAIMTPAASGQAPLGLQSTGSPAFCTPWTLTGVPALSVPLLEGADGMPIGVQVVGRRHDDSRLLRTAHWLVSRMGNPCRTASLLPSRRLND